MTKFDSTCPQPPADVRFAYKQFRKKYGPLLRAAKREMSTTLQRGVLETAVATAFAAGYNAPRTTAPPLKLKGWKAGVDRRL